MNKLSVTSSQFSARTQRRRALTENWEPRTENCFSVIRSFHEPSAAEQIVYETIERDGFSVAQGEVPFVAGPGFAFPPVAGKAPGAGLPEDIPLHVFSSTNQIRGLAVF